MIDSQAIELLEEEHGIFKRGRMPNAENDSCYVVLTDDENLSFEVISKSLYSSLLKDSDAMKGSVIVEMK